MGVAGFRTLLSRALTMAGVHVSRLKVLRIKEDGTLEGWEEFGREVGSDTVPEGEVALVSQLLGLLLTFIGPALTLRMLHDIWPKLDDLDLAEEEPHEEK